MQYLTHVNIIYTIPICSNNVHLFENNTIKKQLGNYFGKYVKLLQLNAITKFFAVSHKIINVTNSDTHKS